MSCEKRVETYTRCEHWADFIHDVSVGRSSKVHELCILWHEFSQLIVEELCKLLHSTRGTTDAHKLKNTMMGVIVFPYHKTVERAQL